MQKDANSNVSTLKELRKLVSEVEEKQALMRMKFLEVAKKCRYRTTVPAEGDYEEYNKCMNPDAPYNYPLINQYGAYCTMRSCPLLGDLLNISTLSETLSRRICQNS